ncbi:hypothetical protein, variant 2 [Aphanomyces invadans]|nr:hypothetical protein, variant 2 [Aphanomyces invadans]ETV95510.1 hypothetical protein, variant 2 [Aphanomyces invadans]|eukprot:XP_008875704.1 hypothetical protein, variant 2 [Aphanomyces invadans]
MPDKVCKVCSDCGESFNIFRRRHHCRGCGHIFCHSCSPYAVESIEQGVKTHVRICKRCHMNHSSSAINTTEVAMDFPPGLMSPIVSQTVFDYGNVAGFDLEFDPSDTVLPSVVDTSDTAQRSNSLYAHLFRRPSSELASALKAIHDAEEHLEKSASSMLDMVDEESGGRGSMSQDQHWHRDHLDCQSPPLSSTKSRLSARHSFTEGMDGCQGLWADHPDHIEAPVEPTPCTPFEAHQMAGRRQLRKLLVRGLDTAVDSLLPDAKDRVAVQDELERVIDETTDLLIRATYNRNAADGMFNHQDMLHIKTIAEVPDDVPSTDTRSTYTGQVIHGIVCRKNVSHKKAPRMLENPRVLLLGGSIVTDRESLKLTKFEDLLNDEAVYAQQLVDKILAVKPSVVFVEQSVSRLAQDQLQLHNIALVLKVKEATLRRLERLTRAKMVPSIDTMQPDDTSVVGTACGSFAVMPMRVADLTKEPGGWKRDSILIVDGCDASAGCTILLKGPNKAVLRALKALVLQLVPRAYDLMLRAEALADLAYPVRSNLADDEPDDKWTFQVIKYMLKHRDEVHKPKFSQCSRPQPHEVAFYSKHDKALGSYLQKEGIDSSTKCQVPNCKVPLIEHLEAYSFFNGTVLISTEHLPDVARTEIERTEGQHAAAAASDNQPLERSGTCMDDDSTGPTIFFWRHCRECSKMVMPPRLLPVTTLKFSFARFLETIFNVPGPQSMPGHGPSELCTVYESIPLESSDDSAATTLLANKGQASETSRHDQDPRDCICPHDGQTQHLLYFKCGKRAIRVEYMHDEPWSIKHDKCLHFDQNWYVAHQRQQAADLKQAMANHFAVLYAKLRTLPPSSREVMCLELLMKTAQKTYMNELTDLMEHGEVVHASSVVDANTVRRAFYHSCCDWSVMVHKITKSLSANATPLDTSPPSNDIAPVGDVDGMPATPLAQSARVELDALGLDTSSTEGAPVEGDLPPLPPISVKELSTGEMTPPVTMSSPSPMSWTTALSNSLGAILLGDKKPMDTLALDPHHAVPDVFAGGHPFLPVGANDRVVYVYDHLRFSFVTYALNSSEYLNETTAIRAALEHDHVGEFLTSPVDTTVKLKVSSSDVEFTCQVHYALQFEALRCMFYGGLVDFVRSLATSQHWSAKGGKSGATFFRTSDDRFVIKYISQVELQSFLASALSYFAYIGKVEAESANSVLCKLVGVYTVTTKKWTEHLVVMENIFCNAPHVDQVFDLKGSTRNRYLVTHDAHPDVLLDGNFLERHLGLPCPLHCRSYTKLVDAIRNDARFLSDNNIMDYSLVIGYASNVPVANDDKTVTTTNRVLLVGIIDYLRHFDFLKRMESVGKSVTMIAGQAAPTVVQPKQYARRFVDAIEQTYFMPVPSFTESVETP